MDSDDDIYEPDDETVPAPKNEGNEVKMEDVDGDVEEGEEEEDSSDDDFNIITDARPKEKSEPLSCVHLLVPFLSLHFTDMMQTEEAITILPRTSQAFRYTSAHTKSRGSLNI